MVTCNETFGATTFRTQLSGISDIIVMYRTDYVQRALGCSFGLCVTASGAPDCSRRHPDATHEVFSWTRIWGGGRLSSGGRVRIKLKLPHFHVSDTRCASIEPNAPVATAARAAATRNCEPAAQNSHIIATTFQFTRGSLTR